MAEQTLDTQVLWREYKRTGERNLRDRLILTYAPLVKYVAGRLGSGLPAHVEEGDLVSYGLLGLIGAIERFDLDRDIKFETYAIARIRGSIIDELRSMDWVPRSVRARARDIERTIAQLEAKGRGRRRTRRSQPLSRDQRERVPGLAPRHLSRTSIAALDELWSSSSTDGDPVALIDTPRGPPWRRSRRPRWGRRRSREVLAEAIARLPEREKLVVTLYYYV